MEKAFWVSKTRRGLGRRFVVLGRLTSINRCLTRVAEAPKSDDLARLHGTSCYSTSRGNVKDADTGILSADTTCPANIPTYFSPLPVLAMLTWGQQQQQHFFIADRMRLAPCSDETPQSRSDFCRVPRRKSNGCQSSWLEYFRSRFLSHRTPMSLVLLEASPRFPRL